MKRKLSKVFILILICLTIMYIFYQSFLLKNENQNNKSLFGFSLYKVFSNSMAPSFFKEDYIIIKKEKEYNIGDIAMYVNKDKYLITHRIIEKYKNEFIFKGDANSIQDDEIVDENQIIGKVIFILKNPFIERNKI